MSCATSHLLDFINGLLRVLFNLLLYPMFINGKLDPQASGSHGFHVPLHVLLINIPRMLQTSACNTD